MRLLQIRLFNDLIRCVASAISIADATHLIGVAPRAGVYDSIRCVFNVIVM